MPGSSTKSSEIVVGIDFGTTNSGVSWAINAGSKSIQLIDTWPQTIANANAQKVPSVLSYADGKPDKWGYKVTYRDNAFRWVKILLQPEHEFAASAQPVQESEKLLRQLNKTAVEVVADYLRIIWNFTKDDIRRKQGEQWENIYSIKIVLTVPAMWTPIAKDRTKEAAIKAGFPADNIELVTEPEAAALATLREKDELRDLKVGDAFVVCDAGGGTVDLISYKVKQIRPLELGEAAVGSGGLCGSVFVDAHFEQYVKTIVGETEYNNIRDQYRQRLRSEFEWQVKKQFTGEGGQEFALEIRDVDDRPPKIVDGNVMLTPVILRGIFDHVFLQVQNLVEQQVADVTSKNLSVKAVLLVGGFGDSKYLHERLKASLKSEGIPVLQVVNAWSAICRGATMWGLEQSKHFANEPHKTITTRLARYSYGVSLSVPFNPVKHLFSDRFWSQSSRAWKVDEMEWLVKRGDEIKEGEIVGTECYVSVPGITWRDHAGDAQFGQLLYYSDEDKPSYRMTDAVKPLCQVDWTIPRAKIWMERSWKNSGDKVKWRNAEMALVMRLGNAAIDYFVVYAGEPVAHTKVSYLERE